jgi:hypothetical protein
MSIKKNYQIGDHAEGGIVFDVNTNGQHGKVVAPFDQSNGANWDQSKLLCSEFNLKGYKDWCLPAKGELDLMYTNSPQSGDWRFCEYQLLEFYEGQGRQYVEYEFPHR